MSEAAQQLLELLKDARPKNPRAQHKYPEKTSAPAGAAVSGKSALKAIRFNVELPELGGALELSPRQDRDGKAVHPWFDPVECKRCGSQRENRRQSWFDEKNNKHHVWWAPVPCNCRGTL